MGNSRDIHLNMFRVVLCVVAIAVIVSATDDNVANKVADKVACPDGNCGQPTHYVKVQGQAAQKIAKAIAPDVQTQHVVKDPAAADQIIKNIKKKPCKKKEVTQQVVHQQVETPVQVVKETVPAKVGPFIKIVKETPVAPAPVVKKVYVPKPVPVPVPVAKKQDGCSVDVSKCFAHRPSLPAPVWQTPVDNFAASFNTMCGPEIKAKATAAEKKKKAEMHNKELCSKNEGNQKYAEKKLKLAAKKESYTKAVAEGKEKFLEKKVKSAEEATAKQIGMTKEKATKSAEASHKQGHVVVIKKSNEGACKEKESKEANRKSEIETKLAVEKVRKELATKEVKSKVVVPVKKPCNPESSLEAYVKHCKGSEEKYEKAKFSGEKNIKEAKAKAKASYVETECKLARQICRRIYKDSSIRDGKIVEMVLTTPSSSRLRWLRPRHSK